VAVKLGKRLMTQAKTWKKIDDTSQLVPTRHDIILKDPDKLTSISC